MINVNIRNILIFYGFLDKKVFILHPVFKLVTIKNMGAFGIFAAILTFVYVIYYAVMISMDLFGNKSQKKDNVEVIASLDNKQNEEEVVDETPTFVDEEGGLNTANTPEDSTDGTDEDQDKQEVAKEDIDSSDNNELYQEAMAAKESAADVDIHSNTDMNADQYEEREAILMREQEECM